MKGYIKQIVGEDVEELYWSSIDIEDEIIRVAYYNFMEEPMDDFEIYWNNRNNDVKIERIFVNEIYI